MSKIKLIQHSRFYWSLFIIIISLMQTTSKTGKLRLVISEHSKGSLHLVRKKKEDTSKDAQVRNVMHL